jgi:hypothetical protein
MSAAPTMPESPPAAATPTTEPLVLPEYKWSLNRISFAIEDITPAQAQKWLSGNVRNRKLDPKHIEKLAGIYCRGNWKFNAMPVIFDTEGYLIDCQHRLHMIVKLGITLPLLVVRGIDPDAFGSLDMSKRRTLSDILGIGANLTLDESGKVLGAAVGFAAAYLKTKTFRTALCVEDERVDVYHEHEGLRAYAKLYRGKNRLRLNGGLLTCCHYFFATKNQAQADEFMAAILEGEIVSSEEPSWRYREWIDRKVGVKRTTKTTNIAGQTLVKAWNILRAGEKCDGPLRPPSIPQEIE